MATATQTLQRYAEDYDAIASLGAGCDVGWLRKLRQDGYARFNEAGFPTTHDEDWRFTSVPAIAQTPFRLPRDGASWLSRADLEPFFMPGAACRLVFVDGLFARELSSLEGLPEGVTAASLASEITRHPDALQADLGRYLDIRRDPFCALNTAFIQDGACVRVGKGVRATEPVHLLFVAAAHDFPAMSHPRNLVVAGEGSQLSVVEDYVFLGSGATLSNSATEVVAGDHSAVAHYRIERGQPGAHVVSTLRIQQGRDARVASHSVLLGGTLVRNNVHPVLAGEGGECLINGLFAGRGREHLDNYMLVEHASPHCGSRQFYNGILGGRSEGVFHGRIIVHKNAQQTDAKQTNRNLLLSDGARMDSKPQLEIYADDVKCTHGATIGQIEEAALFYLRSRGIDERFARRLLLMAFAGECLDRMKEAAVREHAERIAGAFLAGILDAGEVVADEAAAHGGLAEVSAGGGS